MMGVGPFELITILLALFSGGGLLGLPLSVPPLPPDPVVERAAPDECLLHLETAGVAAPAEGAANPVERMLADEEVRSFLAAVAREIVSAAKQSVPLPPQAEEAVLVLLRTALERPWALSVERVTPPTAVAPSTVTATFLLRVGDREKAVRGAVGTLLGDVAAGLSRDGANGGGKGALLRAATPMGDLSWGFVDGSLVVTVGDGVAEPFLERIGDENRGTPAWKADLERRLPVERRATLLHVDVGTMVSLMAATAPNPREGMAMIAATGLGGLRSLDAVSGLGDGGFVADSRLGFDGAPTGIFAAPGKGVGAAQLARALADAVRVQSWSLDGARWLETALGIATAVEPRVADDMRQSLRQIAAVAGFDLEKDLLAKLGPDWTMCDLAAAGGLVPGMALIVGVRDHDGFAATHEKLLALVKRVGAASETKATVATTTYRGRAIHTLSVSGPGMVLPITPAWCLLDDRLVVTLSPQAVKSLVDGTDAPGPAAFAAEVSALGDAEADYVGIVDTRAVFRTLSTAYEFAVPLARQGAQGSGIRIAPPDLPPASAVAPFLAPSVTVLRHEADGIRFRGTTTLPLGPLASLGSGGLSPATTGVAVGLLLPAVQAAREAARRSQTMNNVKQILLAMHNYESEKRRFPSQAICDDEGKALLSWRVTILPYLGEEELYRQFHLDEPWDSAHNRRLVERMPNVYADPNADPATTAAGKTTFQVFTGKGTPFAEPAKGPTLRGITDGTSRTIALSEMLPDDAVPWTKPEDRSFDADKPLEGVGNPRRPGGLFIVALMDGSVRMVDPTIDPDTFKAMVTPAGGEVIAGP